MTIHEIKCWPEYYSPLLERVKPFELRKNDRNYQVNDRLVIREWDHIDYSYTGRCCTAIVDYIFDDVGFGLRPGFCILAIRILTTHTDTELHACFNRPERAAIGSGWITWRSEDS